MTRLLSALGYLIQGLSLATRLALRAAQAQREKEKQG